MIFTNAHLRQLLTGTHAYFVSCVVKLNLYEIYCDLQRYFLFVNYVLMYLLQCYALVTIFFNVFICKNQNACTKMNTCDCLRYFLPRIIALRIDHAR